MKIRSLTVGQLSANCYLLSDKGELAVIDPGDEIGRILKEIAKEKAKFKYIIITHYHFDHTFYSNEIKKIKGGKILAQEAEKDYIEFNADKFLHDGDEIKIGDIKLKAIHTPGHTAGSICLLGENIIFTGDTLFRNGYGRTDLPGGSEEAMQKSLKKLSQIIKPGMTVYPGHGKIYTI